MKGIIVMTNDKNSRCRSSTAYQYNNGIVRERPSHSQASQAIGAKVRSVWATGIPIYCRSAEVKKAIADSGAENSFYSQTSTKPCAPSQRISEIEERIFKRHGDRCFRGFSQKSKEWAVEVVTKSFVCCIFLIGWRIISCLKPIIFWFQRKIFMARTQYA